MSDEIERTCVTCGEIITVSVEEDGSYSGGHYFGSMEVPTDDAEVVSRQPSDIEGFEGIEVVEYSEYEEFEYWECDNCYHG